MSLVGVADLFALLDPPLWVVTAAAGPRRGGLIATFVSPASIVPELPRVLIGVAKQHHTLELIEAAGAFALHLLGAEHLEWVWRFGLISGRGADKLEGLAWRPLPTGAPLLEQTRGWLSCRVEAQLDTGDRTVYLGEVVDGELARPGPPLTLHTMLRLAPGEKLRELKEGMVRDSRVDAARIRAFRDRLPR